MSMPAETNGHAGAPPVQSPDDYGSNQIENPPPRVNICATPFIWRNPKNHPRRGFLFTATTSCASSCRPRLALPALVKATCC